MRATKSVCVCVCFDDGANGKRNGKCTLLRLTNIRQKYWFVYVSERVEMRSNGKVE